MKYTLVAKVDKDNRRLEFDSLWDAHVAACTLVTKGKGWPEKILFGGIELCNEGHLNDFDKKFLKILAKKSNVVLLTKFKNKVLKDARERIMPK